MIDILIASLLDCIHQLNANNLTDRLQCFKKIKLHSSPRYSRKVITVSHFSAGIANENNLPEVMQHMQIGIQKAPQELRRQTVNSHSCLINVWLSSSVEKTVFPFTIPNFVFFILSQEAHNHTEKKDTIIFIDLNYMYLSSQA